MEQMILLKTSSGISQAPLQAKLLSERILCVQGEINADSACDFVSKLIELNLESTDEPITVLINSPGGEVSSGLLMYDSIVGSAAPIRTVCLGKACSMGAVLFMASPQQRLMLPNSELMIHQPLLGGTVSGNASSIRCISDSLLKTKDRINKLISKHTGKSLQEVDDAMSYDHYFSAREAIDFHLCDRIITFSELIELLRNEEE